MNVHVFAGLALAALTAVHLVWRWETQPPLGRVLSRRTLLRLGGLGLGALVVTLVADAIEPLRRATGSKHAGSFTANAMPVTTWVLDAVPQLDAREWRLEVMGREIGYDELASLPRHEVSAVLDCTAGWWSEQRWAGVRVGDLLGDAPAREVRVVSVTGHAWTFPLAEVREMVLATHLGGEPLTAAHGYPARLVAPGRRGFQWIKWVARIELA
jgi:DMSO/TMAO reductase YedYZ molybdopterin-dependent catalytic subunit